MKAAQSVETKQNLQELKFRGGHAWRLIRKGTTTVSISDPACKERSTLSLISYLISLVPLNLVHETWSFFGWVTSSALVYLGYISYPFGCNDINIYKLG